MKELFRFLFKKSITVDDQGVLKMAQGDKLIMMHYLKIEGGVASLTLGASHKVAELRANNKVQLIFSQKGSPKVNATVTIEEDKEKVRALFDTMLEKKCTHFKKWDDDIVILKMKF